MPLFPLFFGQATSGRSARRRAREADRRNDAEQTAFDEVTRRVTKRKAPYGEYQLRSSSGDMGKLRNALTWLTGKAVFGDTNAKIFADWAPRNDLKKFFLDKNGVLYYDSKKKGAIVATKKIIASKSAEDDLLEIISLLALANRDKGLRLETSGAAGLGKGKGKYMTSRHGFLGRKKGHEVAVSSQSYFDPMLEFFSVKDTHKHGQQALIHYDPKGQTFDMGPYEYIMTKRALGVMSDKALRKFAGTLSDIDENLYFDYDNGRLLYRGIDADYIPYEYKKEVGKFLWKVLEKVAPTWEKGDKYGWRNIGPRRQKTPERSYEQSYKKTKDLEPSAEATSSVFTKDLAYEESKKKYEDSLITSLAHSKALNDKLSSESESKAKYDASVATSESESKAKHDAFVSSSEEASKKKYESSVALSAEKSAKNYAKQQAALSSSEAASKKKYEDSVQKSEEESSKISAAAHRLLVRTQNRWVKESADRAAANKLAEDNIKASLEKQAGIDENTRQREMNEATARQLQEERFKISKEKQAGLEANEALARDLALSQENLFQISQHLANYASTLEATQERLISERFADSVMFNSLMDSIATSIILRRTAARLARESRLELTKQRLQEEDLKAAADREAKESRESSEAAEKLEAFQKTVAELESRIAAATEAEQKALQNKLAAEKLAESVRESEEAAKKALASKSEADESIAKEKKRNEELTAEATARRLEEDRLSFEDSTNRALLEASKSEAEKKRQEDEATAAAKVKDLFINPPPFTLMGRSPTPWVAQGTFPKALISDFPKTSGAAPTAATTVQAVLTNLARKTGETNLQLLNRKLEALDPDSRLEFFTYVVNTHKGLMEVNDANAHTLLSDFDTWQNQRAHKTAPPIQNVPTSVLRTAAQATSLPPRTQAATSAARAVQTATATATAAPTPTMDPIFAEFDKLYNREMTTERKGEFFKWLQAVFPPLAAYIEKDEINAREARSVVTAIKEWNRANPPPKPTPGVVGRFARQAANLGLLAAAAPFELGFDGIRWVLKKATAKSNATASEPAATSHAPYVPNPAYVERQKKMKEDKGSWFGTSPAETSTEPAATSRAPVGQVVLTRSRATRGTGTDQMPNSYRDFRKVSTVTSSATERPHDTSTQATTRQAEATRPPTATLADVVQDVLRTPTGKGDFGIAEPGVEQAVGKAQQKVYPRIVPGYTKAEFNKGVTSRIVNQADLAKAVKTVQDNLMGLHQASPFYLYARKISSNLFKKHGYRFSNGMLEKRIGEDKGEEGDSRQWVKVPEEEMVKLAVDSPELWRSISDWSTILSGASYAEENKMPSVYEGLFTTHPELLERVKAANLDPVIKARISFNVGKGRLSIEPKMITEFRKFLAGLSETDRQFLMRQGRTGKFPLIITKSGELLFAKDKSKLKKAMPIYSFAMDEIRAIMATVWEYLKFNGIISTPQETEGNQFDRLDPTRFAEDPNAEPYENEPWMKNRPILHIPRDKEFPELMQRPEAPQLFNESQSQKEQMNLQHSHDEEIDQARLHVIQNKDVLEKVAGILKTKRFGSGAETRKWFDQHGIHDITLDGEGKLIGDVHGYQHEGTALAKALQVNPQTGKTYAEDFAQWVEGLKNQDNRPDGVSDLEYIQDFLAGHGTDVHHHDFRGHFLGDEAVSELQESQHVPAQRKPKYGRPYELYNEKHQFNINPGYWGRFIYRAQLANNHIRAGQANNRIMSLTNVIDRLFDKDKALRHSMIGHVVETKLKRVARYSNNGHGAYRVMLRDDAPPNALDQIDNVASDISDLVSGYPAAQKDTLLKSMSRLGLTLEDVYKFAEEHPDIIKTPFDTGIQEFGGSIFKSYRVMDRPGALDRLKMSVQQMMEHYAEIMPAKMKEAGMVADPSREDNFVVNTMKELHSEHMKRTHGDKPSRVWGKNVGGREALRMFDNATTTLPVREFDPTTNTTKTTGSREVSWRDHLGYPIDSYKLDTEYFKNGLMTPAGWTFLNKFFEPISSLRTEHSSPTITGITAFTRAVDKHQLEDTNTRLIDDVSSARENRAIAAFEVFKRRLLRICIDNGVNTSELFDKNGNFSPYKASKAIETNPNAMRQFKQLRVILSSSLSQKSLSKMDDTAVAEYTRDELEQGAGDYARFKDMTDDEIFAMPWREAVEADYIRDCLKKGIRPESTFVDYILNYWPLMQNSRMKLFKEEADRTGNSERVVTEFYTYYRDRKGEFWNAFLSPKYEQWLIDNQKTRKFYGDSGTEEAPPETKKPEPTVKPAAKVPPKVSPSPTPPPAPSATPQFKTTPTTVTPTPAPIHPQTPIPANMQAPVGQSTVNAQQPWTMGQQNANLGGTPGAATMSGMGINAGAQQKPPINLGSAQFAGGAQATPAPQPTQNPFVGQQQTFTPPQQHKVTPEEAQAIKNAFTSAEQAHTAAQDTTRASSGGTASRSAKGEDEVREETVSPDWVHQDAKEGGPAGTNERLWKLINWLKNKSTENLEDQHALINQGSAGRAMLTGAVNMVKGRPKYYNLVQDKIQTPKRKR